MFVKQQPGSWLSSVVACVDPTRGDQADSVLKSACQVASRSVGCETEVKALYVSRSTFWKSRESSLLTDLLKNASSVSPQQIDVDEPVVSSRSVKRALVDGIRDKNPDLCVIGSNTGRLQAVFSTAQYVLRHAPCDVLVVPETGSDLDHAMKALVCFGINDWEGSIDAFKATLRIARPGDTVEAVHVVYAGGPVDAVFGPPMMVPRGNGTTGEKISAALEQAMLEVLDDAACHLNREDIEIKPTVLFAGIDNPIKVLVDYGEQRGANLLSVGVGSIEKIFNPVNFSYQLTRKSPVSVLVARRTVAPEQVMSYYVEDPELWVQSKSFI